MSTKHHCYWSYQGLYLMTLSSLAQDGHRLPTWIHIAAQNSGNIVLSLNINNPGHGLHHGPLPNECHHPPAGKAFREGARGTPWLEHLLPDTVAQLNAEDWHNGPLMPRWRDDEARHQLVHFEVNTSSMAFPNSNLTQSLNKWHVNTRDLGAICPKPQNKEEFVPRIWFIYPKRPLKYKRTNQIILKMTTDISQTQRSYPDNTKMSTLNRNPKQKKATD